MKAAEQRTLTALYVLAGNRTNKIVYGSGATPLATVMRRPVLIVHAKTAHKWLVMKRPVTFP